MANTASISLAPAYYLAVARSLGILAALFHTSTLLAGGEGAQARKEFKQSPTYPYTFVPVCYLEDGGPQPMRFGLAVVDCGRHNAPPLTPAAAGTEKAVIAAALVPTPNPPLAQQGTGEAVTTDPTTIEAGAPPPLVTPPLITPLPAYPPGNFRPVLPDGELDFNKQPNEVMEFFKDPYNVPGNRGRYIDPVFEPAYNPSDNPIHTGPTSRATYREE